MPSIELRADDDCFTRARKMCSAAGFNPRESSTGLIGAFAEVLFKYQQLDKFMFETKSRDCQKET